MINKFLNKICICLFIIPVLLLSIGCSDKDEKRLKKDSEWITTAAEQEAQLYITAFTAWQIETADDEEDLESFQAYCVELELVKDLTEAQENILEVNVEENLFVIKSSKDLYVKWEAGEFTVSEDSLVSPVAPVEPQP